jgi:hypothetical protein
LVEAFGNESQIFFQMLFGPSNFDELFKSIGSIVKKPRSIGDGNDPVVISRESGVLARIEAFIAALSVD